ncbi:MAG: CerR family C-terminal domain-containing protein [Nitratireductor sp.]|nr:CerR family C-terminal domain-containing protein [Nitratireductor sp.]
MQDWSKRKQTGEGDADSTRMALIEAGLDRFGVKGYDAASTREIAAAAGANIASIAYHFGGKEGLRRACAEYVAGLIGSVARSVFGADFEKAESAAAALPAAEARTELVNGMMRLLRFLLLQPQAKLIVRFMLREIMSPSIALDIIYGGIFRPVHRRLCALWSAATGKQMESEEVRLAVFAMLGQAVYFRIAQEVVQRRMDWREVGEAEVESISRILIANLNDSLDRDARAAGGERK